NAFTCKHTTKNLLGIKSCRKEHDKEENSKSKKAYIIEDDADEYIQRNAEEVHDCASGLLRKLRTGPDFRQPPGANIVT
nr:hypothetical protein [Tanacetum cinerariifolium]